MTDQADQAKIDYEFVGWVFLNHRETYDKIWEGGCATPRELWVALLEGCPELYATWRAQHRLGIDYRRPEIYATWLA